MSTEYRVEVAEYAKRYFIKDFSKKYKGAWDITWRALLRELESFEVLLDSSIAETVVDAGEVRICKVEFRIAGTTQSRKGSGNRCIVAVHAKRIVVLLAYHKNHLKGSGSETATWKRMVKEQFPEYRTIV